MGSPLPPSPAADFDPSRYLTKVSGNDYLEVKWRLLWLRTTHPDAVIETDMMQHDGQAAIFKATVSLPGPGGSATGWGSEQYGDFRDYIEKAECLPLTVPMLTRAGWKHYHQLTVGEEVLACNPKTNLMEWTTLLAVNTFPETTLVRIGNSRFSAVCTPDHKWLLNGRLTPWNERSGSGAETITLAAPLAKDGGDPDAAARLAWLMTDCRLSYAAGLPSRADVQQSKPENFDELNRLFGTFTRENQPSERDWGNGHVSVVKAQRIWSVPANEVRTVLGRFGVSTRDDLPRAVLWMTRDEAAAFLTAAMAADGSTRSTSATFAKTSLPVVEAVQLAALLTGRTSSVIKERAPNQMTTKPCYTVGIHKHGHKYTSEFKTTVLPPREVWCPTTAFGTWVANFNGFIGITGNTKALGRALAALGFGTQFCNDFAFGADQNRIVDAPVDLHRQQERRQQQNGPATQEQKSSDQPATSRQHGFIDALTRELSLTEEALKLEVESSFGVPVSGLSRRDASVLIERLQQRRADRPSGTTQ